ncbi:MAG: DoxX family protein [Flavobacteriaceae bacterium]|nr:DoxX family protein [Flavobacteriaceae bacterium]MDO7715890.1 DoxX family protein [Flavobacteriaceae bacterium]
MKYIKYILMAVVSFVVINVWFFRFNNPTIYRGGKAANMIEEFAVYGLSETIVYIIGGLKVLAAIGLLIGFVNRKAILPSAALMGALMLGAVFMHFKVSDEAIKFLPAGLMLLFSLTIILINKQKQLS